ncbi:MAG: phosphoribosylanthranilate isomerase [Acidobacteriota bacterium]|nr:phosphoribosylanthranilate isomerase [Acidobacteriota bacterium]
MKVCGLTREEDVHAACALGAAYVGFNFSALSPRRVRPERARRLAAAAKGAVRVGVFVDESYRDIEEAVAQASLDLVQIHRPLAADDLERVGVPVLAVAHAGRDEEIPPRELLERCAGILIDSSSAGGVGGTGLPFDWTLLGGRAWPVPLFVAGGLHSANVGDSIARTRPAAVDVASGLEASPGVKDHAKMERFFAAVREADARAG